MRIARTITPLWAGLMIGISFVATPVKFQAETLTHAAALDVGRHTFAASHLAQLALAAFAMCVARRRAVVASAVLLLVQVFVLMPILTERARIVIAGGEPTGWSPHLLYVVLDLAKLGLLLVAATTTSTTSTTTTTTPRTLP